MKKATGIVRKIDELGRVVIPKELRRVYGIKEGDAMEIFVDNDEIILRKYTPSDGCTLCGSIADRYAELGSTRICPGCAELIIDRLEGGE